MGHERSLIIPIVANQWDASACSKESLGQMVPLKSTRLVAKGYTWQTDNHSSAPLVSRLAWSSHLVPWPVYLSVKGKRMFHVCKEAKGPTDLNDNGPTRRWHEAQPSDIGTWRLGPSQIIGPDRLTSEAHRKNRTWSCAIYDSLCLGSLEFEMSNIEFQVNINGAWEELPLSQVNELAEIT